MLLWCLGNHLLCHQANWILLGLFWVFFLFFLLLPCQMETWPQWWDGKESDWNLEGGGLKIETGSLLSLGYARSPAVNIINGNQISHIFSGSWNWCNYMKFSAEWAAGWHGKSKGSNAAACTPHVSFFSFLLFLFFLFPIFLFLLLCPSPLLLRLCPGQCHQHKKNQSSGILKDAKKLK